MAKIDIKQPKYIIPLVMLPFILVIGYAVSTFSNKKKDNAELVTTEEMNADLQTAASSGTQTKIEALRNAFRQDGDFSGIQNVEKEYDDMTANSGSLYSTDEMIYIDSINQMSRIKEEEIKRMTERYISKDYSEEDSLAAELSNTYPGMIVTGTPGTTTGTTTRTTTRSGQQQNYNSPHVQDSTIEQKIEAARQKQQARINKQISKIDSLRYVGQVKEEQIKTNNYSSDTANVNGRKKLPNGGTSIVYKNNTAENFNTLSNDDSSDGIVAMLDETVTVRGSSRIRIRLLEDVVIENPKTKENIKMKSGDYLYGIVSGITGQRVTISVNSIMIKGKIHNVDLVVYDNDGMEGFFIPDNYFREMTKQIGANAVSQTNFTFENATETWQSLIYKTLNNIIRQLTSSISNTIRIQKATLKYNTQIYLYNKNTK